MLAVRSLKLLYLLRVLYHFCILCRLSCRVRASSPARFLIDTGFFRSRTCSTSCATPKQRAPGAGRQPAGPPLSNKLRQNSSTCDSAAKFGT